jgi:hypothetical protein
MWSMVNTITSSAFEIWLTPFRGLSPLVQVCITALPVTIFALVVFRLVSNQAGITRTKDLIKGYLLELWLYKDDPVVLLRAQGQVLLNSVRYFRYSLVPLLIMIVPMALVIVQVETHFGWRSLHADESVIVTATLKPGAGDAKPPSSLDATLSVPEGVTLETPPLRLDKEHQVLWRVRPDVSGKHEIQLKIGKSVATAGIESDQGTIALAPVVYQAGDWRELGYPAGEPLSAGSAVESVEVAYPRRYGEYLGLSGASWMLLGASLVFGFALRGVFGVTF